MMHDYLIFAVIVGVIVPVCGIVYLVKIAQNAQRHEEERAKARAEQNNANQ